MKIENNGNYNIISIFLYNEYNELEIKVVLTASLALCILIFSYIEWYVCSSFKFVFNLRFRYLAYHITAK